MPTNVETKWPGVYIEELSSESLSISHGVTAVPVFAAGPSDNSGFPCPIITLNSWQDFVDGLGNLKDSDGNPPPKVPDYNRTAQAALRAYFENGGGYCYLVLTSELARYVPTLDGVTLIVAAGKPLSDVQSQVGLMMEAEPSLRIFTIYDGPTEELDINSDPTSMLLTASNQAAVYYPWLEAPWAVHPTELEEDGTKKKTYVPPSGAIAGVYCTVGRERGVWKAPANVPLKGDLRPVYKVSDELMWQL